MRRRAWLQAAAAAAATLARHPGAHAALPAGQAPRAESPSAPAIPRSLPLIDSAGTARDLQALVAGHTVAVNFIFTGCNSFCPPQTAVFRSLQDRLGPWPGRPDPLLISLTLDPLNDTPAALTAYAARYGARLGLSARWLMLTGDPGAVDQALRAFGASSVRPDEHPAQVWVGCAQRQKWSSVNGLPNPQILLDMMQRVAT